MGGRSAAAVEATGFLNIDLDVAGPVRVMAPLAIELERRFLCLHAGVVRGRWAAHYETRTQHRTVEATMRGLLRVVERLPDAAKQAWSRATRRDFDIGIQAGREPHAARWAIDTATLARVAAVGGRVLITVYAPFPRPKATREA
jgi:hypothetical protein